MRIQRTIRRWWNAPTVSTDEPPAIALLVVFGRTTKTGVALAFCELELVLEAARSARHIAAVDWVLCGDEMGEVGPQHAPFIDELARIVSPGVVYMETQPQSPLMFELKRRGVRVRVATHRESGSRSAA